MVVAGADQRLFPRVAGAVVLLAPHTAVVRQYHPIERRRAMAIRIQAARRNGTNGRTTTARRRPVDINEVAKVAYELFERRGRRHGCDRQDWFDAERIVQARNA